MRKMMLAMMVCVTVTAIVLSGQSVWAGAEVTDVQWYWCPPNNRILSGTTIYSDGLSHARGVEFYSVLCRDKDGVEDRNCCKPENAQYRESAGYLFLLTSNNWKPAPEGGKDNVGAQWGDFWISSGITGVCTGCSATTPCTTCEAEGVLWEGTFSGYGDGTGYRFQKLVGFGVGNNAGLKLKALAETVDTSTGPSKNSHVINGYILNPGGKY
jgi:hypothetical protein